MFRRLLLPLLFLTLAAPGVRAAPLLDIMLLLDSSGSISDPDYANQQDWGQQVIDKFAPTGAGTHMGLITYATSVFLRSGLTGDAVAVGNALSGANQQLGQTNHGGAFEAAANEFDTNGRAGVQQVVIFLSDGRANEPLGQPQDPVSYAIDQATALKADGALIFGIGIGSAIGLDDLANYVSAPTDASGFLLDDFSDQAGFTSALNSIFADVEGFMGPPPVAEVSAPASLAFLGLGMAALAVTRRRRFSAT